MSNDPKAIGGSKKYSRTEIMRQNGVVAKPTTPQTPPTREATARRVPRPDDPPPPTPNPALKPGTGWKVPATSAAPTSVTAPKGVATPKQAKPSSTVNQTAPRKRSPISWTPVIVAVVIGAFLLGGILLWKNVGVGPAVAVANQDGTSIEGTQVGDNGGSRAAPTVTGTCKFNAYDANPGTNEFGPKPDPEPTNGSEARDQQAVVMAEDCKYAATQYVLNVLNEPLNAQTYVRVEKLIWDKTEEFRRNANAWQDGVNQFYAKADKFILLAAPNERYWSFGFIPSANGDRNVQPKLTQLGERQDLSLALIVLKKDGTLLDKYRVPCQYQNVDELELPKPVTPPTPHTPDTPDNPECEVDCGGEPPLTCEEIHGPDSPECNPEPPLTCEEIHGPDSPECNPCPPGGCNPCPPGGCECPPGECKSPNPDDYPHEVDPPVGVIDTPPAPPVVIPNPAGDRPVPAPSGPEVQAPEAETPPAQYDPQTPPIEQSEPEETANDTDVEPGGDSTVG